MAWPTKTDFVDGDVLNASQMNNIGTNLNLANPTGITDGYVLTADGAGSMAWEPVATGGITILASGSLSTSALDLTSINQTYRQLQLILRDFNVSTINNWGIQFNGLTGPTNGYSWMRLYGTTNTVANTGTSIGIDQNWNSGASVTFNLIIPNYAATYYQTCQWWTADRSQGVNGFGTAQYRDSTFAVNRIRFFSLSGATFTAGTYELRGIK